MGTTAPRSDWARAAGQVRNRGSLSESPAAGGRHDCLQRADRRSSLSEPEEYPHWSIDKRVDKRRPDEARLTATWACQDLTGPQACSGPGGAVLAVGVAAEVKSKLAVVDVVGESVSLKKAGTTYKGLCPFHGEKTPSFVVTPQPRQLALLRMRTGGRHLQLRHAARRRHLPRGTPDAGQRAGVEIDERTKRDDAHKARLRQVLDHRDRVLSRRADAVEGRHSRPGLSPRPGVHRRDDRHAPARLGARRLGPDDPDAGHEARRPAGGAGGGRASPSPRQSGRNGVYDKFRSRVAVPDPRPERPRRRPGRPAARRRRAKVPQLAGDAAVRQESDALSHRQGQGSDPQDRPGRHRRGLHGRPDGAPGRLRQCRREPWNGANPGPCRPADPLCRPDRAGV